LKDILLIDDSATQLRLRETILRDSGYVVDIATEVESAVKLLHASPERFGLVISDHLLQGATGVDVVTRIRSFLPKIPVIIISGMPDLEDDYKSLNVIVRQKPLAPAELIELTRTQLQAA
jgi:DNA-binding NtrC family response regulator